MGKYEDLVADIGPSKSESGKYDDLVVDIQAPSMEDSPTTMREAAGKALFGRFRSLPVPQAVMNPKKAHQKYGALLPIVGGTLAGPAAPVGAALGEVARQVTGQVVNPDGVPQSRLGIAANVFGQGVAAEPKLLGMIPGVKPLGRTLASGAKKAGTKLAEISGAFTGTKPQDLVDAAKGGLGTYLKPGIEKAQEVFKSALKAEGIPTRRTVKQIVDPQLTQAKKTALAIGSKLEKHLPITAGEALKARQAVDRIYAATPVKDRSTLSGLAELRRSFDDIVSEQSGALKNASRTYRTAIVKRAITEPLRQTKSGVTSAVVPILSALSAGGLFSPKTREASGASAIGMLGATSPLIHGLAATGGGTAARLAMALASNPAVRQYATQKFLSRVK